MSIRIESGYLHQQHMRTRMPFRYGIVTMTEFPLAFLVLRIRIEGKPSTGIASDLLPPKWFTKIPGKPVDEEIEEMTRVIRHALDQARGREAGTIFDLWQGLYRDQARHGEREGLAPLLVHFGTSMVERALIDAFCRHGRIPFDRTVREGALGIRLGEIHPELQGREPADLLPERPLEEVMVRHTVGLVDPLEDRDIPAGERLNDGLPQSLESCIGCYGLRHFKIKVSGDVAFDGERLRRILDLVERCGIGEACYTLDGNEQFSSVDAFRDYWEELTRRDWFPALESGLLFVEQPLHRDAALAAGVRPRFHAWKERPLVIIDESDGEIGSLPRALELGYHGTSHKNCKGVIRGIANRALVEKRKREEKGSWIMSGEDLCNQGPVALLQDLSVMATLGIESVERNGHHYCAGLSGMSRAVQSLMLQEHPDLYHPGPKGWPTLRIEKGRIALGSLLKSPFGIGPALEDHLVPAELLAHQVEAR